MRDVWYTGSGKCIMPSTEMASCGAVEPLVAATVYLDPTGTFTGKLAGNRLGGTATEEGTTTYSYNPHVRSFRRTRELYIEDYNK